MRLGYLWPVLPAMILAACATSTNLLSESEIAGMQISSVVVTYKPDASISWDRATREFVEKQLAANARTAGKSKRPPTVTDASQAGTDPASAEYQKIASSPEAKAYERETLSRLVRQRLERDVVPEFKGARPVVLEITITSFVIPSAVQRAVIGGTPIMGAMRQLKDAKTGAELGKLDQATAAGAGSGIIGVLVDQALSDLEDRLLDQFVDQTKRWLKKG